MTLAIEQQSIDPINTLEVCDTVYFFLDTIPPARHTEFATAMTSFYLNSSDLSGLEFVNALHHEIPLVITTLQKMVLDAPGGSSYADITARNIRRKLRANPTWYAHGLMLTAAHIWYQKHYKDDRFTLEIFADVWMESSVQYEQTESWAQRFWNRALEFLDTYKFLFLGLGIGGFFWLSHPRH
jgi:hypothetical protein